MSSLGSGEGIFGLALPREGENPRVRYVHRILRLNGTSPHETRGTAARLADAPGLDRTIAYRSHALASHIG